MTFLEELENRLIDEETTRTHTANNVMRFKLYHAKLFWRILICSWILCRPLNWKLAGCWHSLSREVRAPHVTLIRYRHAKPGVAHAPGMPGTFSPPSRVSDPVMHHSTCVTHVPWCMPGSLTSSFLWSLWRGKRSQHYRRMRNPQFLRIWQETHISRNWTGFPEIFRLPQHPAGMIVTQLKNTSAKSCYPNAITYAIMNIR